MISIHPLHLTRPAGSLSETIGVSSFFRAAMWPEKMNCSENSTTDRAHSP